jgi:general secretion pathway protein D
MALNNQEAKIHVGSKVAKITRTLLNVGSTTSNPVTTENVEFLDVGVKLAVTPSIGDDGSITMKVKPEVSSVENTITTSEGSSIPVIRVSEAEASLVVKDGITVVLGGLIEDAKSRTDVRVPVLGSIPIIGALFRSRDRTRLKTELVIFLTPHIITGDAVSPEAQTKFDLEPDGTPQPKKGFFQRHFGRK